MRCVRWRKKRTGRASSVETLELAGAHADDGARAASEHHLGTGAVRSVRRPGEIRPPRSRRPSASPTDRRAFVRPMHARAGHHEAVCRRPKPKPAAAQPCSPRNCPAILSFELILRRSNKLFPDRASVISPPEQHGISSRWMTNVVACRYATVSIPVWRDASDRKPKASHGRKQRP